MRIMTSTTDVLEQRVALAEGGVAAIAVANHQAALTSTVLNLAEAGDNIVVVTGVQDSTITLFTHTLPRLGIRSRFVDMDDLGAIAATIDHQTRALFFECLGEPTRDRSDIAALARLAHDFNLPLIVDNSATSTELKPLPLGADVVLYRATRWLGIPDADVGGLIVDSGRFNWGATSRFRRLFSEPEPAYHGIRFAEAFGDASGVNRAFSARLRVLVLPAIGATLAPTMAAQLLHALDANVSIVRPHEHEVFDAGCAA
jgi:O-acetylhomoserine (thiol)-lyase